MPDGPRYEDDFYAWTQYQAEVLREMECNDQRFDRENLAEEIQCLGRRCLHEVFDLVGRVIEKFLLLEYGPEGHARYGLKRTIVEARADIEDRISPIIGLLAAEALSEIYQDSRELADLRLRELGMPAVADNLPLECPYTLDQVLAKGWYPEPSEQPK